MAALAGYPHLQLARPDVDVTHVSRALLAGLERVGRALGRTVTIFSGYRSDAYSASVGGFAGDPHTRGIAVDANVDGAPIGTVPGAMAALAAQGLVSGNQPGFYNGKPDPAHVQLSSAATSTSAGGSNTFPGWERAVLRLINAPVTAANVAFLDQWHSYEQSGASNNPLNTTLPAAGASNFNSAGVKNYPSASVGAQATAATLKNGKYPHLLAALQSGDPTQYSRQGQRGSAQLWQTVLADLRRWGSGSFASKLDGSSSGPDVGSAVDAAGNVIDATLAVPRFLARLTDPAYILRGLQVVAGAVLVLVGVYLLARQVGLAFSESALAPAGPPAKAALQGARRLQTGIGQGELAHANKQRPAVREDLTSPKAVYTGKDTPDYGEIPY